MHGFYGDHPRLRGEQSADTVNCDVVDGSPPLTRGTAVHCSYACDIAGITPAYAGNSTTSAVIATANRDHPRLRGEQ